MTENDKGLVAMADRASRMEEAINLLVSAVDHNEGNQEYTDDDITAIIRQLDDIELAVRWLKGDVLLSHKRRRGAMRAYEAGAAGLGKSTRWAIELTKVAEIFPMSYRLAGLPWHVYRQCASHDKPYESLFEIANEKLGKTING